MVMMQAHTPTASSVSNGATMKSKNNPSSWWCIISRAALVSNLFSIQKKVSLMVDMFVPSLCKNMIYLPD